MSLTNIELVKMLSTLGPFKSKKLPQKISYAITKNIRNCKGEYEIYIEELNKIISRYKDFYIKDEKDELTIDENGLPVIDDEHKKEFQSDIMELLQFKVMVNVHTIPYDSFDYDDAGKYDVLTCDEILALQDIMCKDESKGDE